MEIKNKYSNRIREVERSVESKAKAPDQLGQMRCKINEIKVRKQRFYYSGLSFLEFSSQQFSFLSSDLEVNDGITCPIATFLSYPLQQTMKQVNPFNFQVRI